MEISNIAFLLVFAISCEHVVYCIVLYCIVLSSDSGPSQMPSNLGPPLQAQQKPLAALPNLPSKFAVVHDAIMVSLKLSQLFCSSRFLVYNNLF